MGTSHGEIRKLPNDDSSFIWEIPDFFKIIEDNILTVSSPTFPFQDETWDIQLDPRYVGPSSIALRLRCFCSRKVNYAVTYRFCIKNVSGKHYWNPKPFKEEIDPNKVECGFQPLFKYNLLKEKCNLSKNEDLALIFIFDNVTILKETMNSPLESAEERNSPGDHQNPVHKTRAPDAEERNSSEDHGNPVCYTTGVEKLLQDLKKMLLNEEDCDVTLNIRAKKIRAHKAILKTRSPVFRSMFQHEMAENRRNVVNISDCEPDVFQEFLLYLYTGKLDEITRSDIVDLYCVADKYDVKELASDCVQRMVSGLAIATFCAYVTIAARHNEQAIIVAAEQFLSVNLKVVIVSVEWQTIENPVVANELLVKALAGVKLIRN